MKIVKKVTAQLAARKRELVAELEQVDGALRALAGAESRDIGPVIRAVERVAERRQEAPKATPQARRPRQVARAPRKAAPLVAAPRGRPARTKPEPEPEEQSQLLRGTVGTKTTPGGQTYMVCPKCGKRTDTNPCKVCGKKIIIAPNLRSIPAEAFEDDDGPLGPEEPTE